ncbi:toxin [Bathymodiolus japonicus methanotrophic gill symbiont]|uniref:nucleotidyltransferase domain-containing protein n=1 Tax=Bathymodiolus japonicus methanotrophic gill symbiont TaxID=113269 RepID=UPI001B650CAF|nr:nucleotidyltransferase domain-containing protein [Bathymodiolus japonicus methanotrophic gill symbiont]GFO71247.1 toxin [Bathymodiolus japonicus methanotrophic gill symbiont]
MRLTKDEINNIKNSVLTLDASADVYLFGSRVDDSKRGGDIDLLITSTRLNEQNLRTIRRQFFDRFGEQKMDLFLDAGDTNNAFINMIKPNAIKL